MKMGDSGDGKKSRGRTPAFPPDPDILPRLLANGFCPEASVYPRGGRTQDLFLPPSSLGDDSSRVPHSFEEPRGRCQPSLFLQQHPLPRSPLGSSAPAPLLAPGLPSPQGPTTTAPPRKNLPSPPMMHQPPFSGTPRPPPSSPLPSCLHQLLKPASTPRLPQTRLPAHPVPRPGALSPQNLLPGLQSPRPNPPAHTLCPCTPPLRSPPRVALPRPQALCGDWLAGLNGGQKVGSRLRRPQSRVPKGQRM